MKLNKIKNNEIKKGKNSELINSINFSNKSSRKFKNNQNSENINLNNKPDKKNKTEDKIIYDDFELNSMEYLQAKKLDKRICFEIYFSLMKKNHPLISSIIPFQDYNSMTIKICLLIFYFSLSFFLNSLFFTDKTMHQIYEDEGAFKFIYNLPNIIYSTIISALTNFFIKKLALTEESILSIKNEKN